MAKHFDLAFSAGESFYFRFEARDAAGQALDLTGALVEWVVVALNGSGTSLLATSANTMIVITSAALGLGYVNVSPANHVLIVDGEYAHELRVTSADTTVGVQIEGALTVGTSLFSTVGSGLTSNAYDNGVKSAGTFTPSALSGLYQKAVNGGAHALAVPATGTGNAAQIIMQYTNNASAGVITTTAFTKVTGSALTIVNGDDFIFRMTVINGFSWLEIQALQ